MESVLCGYAAIGVIIVVEKVRSCIVFLLWRRCIRACVTRRALKKNLKRGVMLSRGSS